MREIVYEKLYDVEDRHWWFAGKRRIIRGLLERYVRPRGATVLVADIGCGCGRSLEELPEGFAGTGVDPSPLAIEFCRKRGVDARYGSLPDEVGLEAGGYDTVIMADVLEHIEDDRAAVEAAAGLLAPGGIMIVTVPAFMSLWTQWDEVHGHVRRYTKARFAEALENDFLKTRVLSYYNTFLFAPAAAVRLANRFLRRDSMGEMSLPPALLNAALREVFAVERHILGRLPLPFGLSLVAVMERTGAP